MNFSKLIADYIRDQWLNFRRSFNDPQAREALLGSSRLYFYEPGTTIPAASYADADLYIPNCHPVLANANGEFHPLFLDPSKAVSVVLKDCRDQTIFTAADAREFTVCPTCGK